MHLHASPMGTRLAQLISIDATSLHSQRGSRKQPAGAPSFEARRHAQPSPSSRLLSSHCSSNRRFPSPCSAVQVELKNPGSRGSAPQIELHRNPHSIVHASLQPSPDMALPSSQLSPTSLTTLPLPHVSTMAVALGSHTPMSTTSKIMRADLCTTEQLRGIIPALIKPARRLQLLSLPVQRPSRRRSSLCTATAPRQPSCVTGSRFVPGRRPEKIDANVAEGPPSLQVIDSVLCIEAQRKTTSSQTLPICNDWSSWKHPHSTGTLCGRSSNARPAITVSSNRSQAELEEY